jgi:hypothetical protein
MGAAAVVACSVYLDPALLNSMADGGGVDAGNTDSGGGSNGDAATADATPIVVATLVTPTCVRADNDNIYWTAMDGTAAEFSKGTRTTRLLQDGGVTVANIYDCAIDATFLYQLWSSPVNGISGAGVFPIAESTDKYNTCAKGPNGVMAIAVDPTGPPAYVTQPTIGSIVSCTPETSDTFTPFVASDAGATPDYVTVFGGYVYFTDSTGIWIQKTTTGSTAQMLSTDADGPAAIAADGSGVYWVDANTGRVMNLPMDGSSTTPKMIAQGDKAAGPRAIVLDANHVYWVASQTGNVWGANKNATQVGVIASGQASPWSIAVDDSFVYWANRDANGSIMQIAKLP